jgi:hypothetical protein
MHAPVSVVRQRNQVPGFDTGGVSALVVDVPFSWDRTFSQPMHDAVGFLAAKDRAQILVDLANPGPAGRGLFFHHQLKEFFSDR